MARRPNIQREATALLGETLKATRSKLREFEDQGIPIDAATISASVSLLKLVEAYTTATRGEKEADLERLRQDFEARRAAPMPTPALATPSPEELRRQNGLTET